MDETKEVELLTIDEVIKELEDIKSKFGNLKVGQIFYATEENKQGKDEVSDVAVCLARNPIDKDKYIVIFD